VWCSAGTDVSRQRKQCEMAGQRVQRVQDLSVHAIFHMLQHDNPPTCCLPSAAGGACRQAPELYIGKAAQPVAKDKVCQHVCSTFAYSPLNIFVGNCSTYAHLQQLVLLPTCACPTPISHTSNPL
jgi:hypothetical protein